MRMVCHKSFDHSGTKIFLRDPRAFARMWLVSDICEITDKLGPEPLTKEFTSEVLAERLKGKSAPIKSVLIDQAVIAAAQAIAPSHFRRLELSRMPASAVEMPIESPSSPAQ